MVSRVSSVLYPAIWAICGRGARVPCFLTSHEAFVLFLDNDVTVGLRIEGAALLPCFAPFSCCIMATHTLTSCFHLRTLGSQNAGSNVLVMCS